MELVSYCENSTRSMSVDLPARQCKVTYTWVATEIKKSGCCWPEYEDWSFEELYARDLRFEN